MKYLPGEHNHSIVDTENIELELFIAALKSFSGYDLSEYSRSSLKRRVINLTLNSGFSHISELIPRVAHNPDCRQDIVNKLTVNVSELFRDPWVFLALKQQVLPYLASFPRRDIWIAGCANGEEAYSLAILLAEANLLERTFIHATDISTVALRHANSGILTRPLTPQEAKRYQDSGGLKSISRYFSSAYGKVKLSQHLLDHISFASHNLTRDAVFCSAQLVLCRNVLIYFTLELQHKVLQLLFDSVVDNGYLVIGPKESLSHAAICQQLTVVDKPALIYQRRKAVRGTR